MRITKRKYNQTRRLSGWNEWQSELVSKPHVYVNWPSFAEAKKIIAKLEIKGKEEYLKNRPSNLPSAPHKVYKQEWVNWTDFLGNSFPAYAMAKKLAQSLKVNTPSAYQNKNPVSTLKLPRHPESYYESEWEGWDVFLGADVPVRFDKSITFSEVKGTVRLLGFKTEKEYLENRPKDKCPAEPDYTFADEWKGWDDFFGRVPIIENFEEARKVARSLNCRTLREYKERKPENLPPDPVRYYRNTGYKNLADFLGYSKIRNGRWPQAGDFVSYKECKKYASKNNIKSSKDWFTYVRNGTIPDNIPKVPHHVYKDSGWIDWYDFLDTTNETIKNKEELLKLAKTGCKRPVKRSGAIGRSLVYYTSKSHHSYDAVFDKQIRKLAPHWFEMAA